MVCNRKRKPLSAPRVLERSDSPRFVHHHTGPGNHCAVIDAVPVIHGAHLTASLLDHLFDHFLQSLVTWKAIALSKVSINQWYELKLNVHPTPPTINTSEGPQ
jgi:hypothetical protein